MKRFSVSLLIGLCIFLSHGSSRIKSNKILVHLSSEHSTSKLLKTHHHGHKPHQSHESKQDQDQDQGKSDRHEHQHVSELSSLAIHLVLPEISPTVTPLSLPIARTEAFYSADELPSLSFTSSIFRPPIA